MPSADPDTNRESRVLLNSSMSAQSADHNPHRTGLMAFMRKALRPGHSPDSKGFHQPWS
jgi:hypothetical protein